MMACMGVMRALNRHVVRELNPSRKDDPRGDQSEGLILKLNPA